MKIIRYRTVEHHQPYVQDILYQNADEVAISRLGRLVTELPRTSSATQVDNEKPPLRWLKRIKCRREDEFYQGSYLPFPKQEREENCVMDRLMAVKAAWMCSIKESRLQLTQRSSDDNMKDDVHLSRNLIALHL